VRDQFPNARREEEDVLTMFICSFQLWVEGKITRDFEGSNAVAPNPVTLEVYLNTNPKARQLLDLQ
jgi:hypothetical protein